MNVQFFCIDWALQCCRWLFPTLKVYATERRKKKRQIDSEIYEHQPINEIFSRNSISINSFRLALFGNVYSLLPNIRQVFETLSVPRAKLSESCTQVSLLRKRIIKYKKTDRIYNNIFVFVFVLHVLLPYNNPDAEWVLFCALCHSFVRK